MVLFADMSSTILTLLQHAWQKILADIYVALTTGVMVTKRLGSHPPRDSNTDKAYQTHLLPRSLVAYTTNYSRYVDDVVCTCRATRKALNVVKRPEQQ